MSEYNAFHDGVLLMVEDGIITEYTIRSSELRNRKKKPSHPIL